MLVMLPVTVEAQSFHSPLLVWTGWTGTVLEPELALLAQSFHSPLLVWTGSTGMVLELLAQSPQVLAASAVDVAL
jgi:hypothetical protein